ncbi:hypothetical protein BOTBODRAFT_129478 [Botryobasidium botryosum FD-172 SS1]|uniref:Major facilitator superfamily (MFS) profile domain-containing protein n=1 Tax=Botryobasidium botryosum (strain FD-172 SS1) TaxID=930990 RepID=A0A067MM25_BOTB1|nr:hypothetical protein BOTBODRAFT_129478 [Botryobasidium botryosum FD-172 SS1]
MQTLPLSNSQFNIANVVCIISWSAFETPSNILLKKFRPSRWMAFLMLSWGAVTLAHAAVHDYKSLYALRFLLGAAEAGVFPGLVYFLTFWYKPSERLLRIAIIFATATAAGAFGGALAYGIGNLDGLSGLEGWRWLFILEGLPCCVCAVLVFLIMPDFPETAKWLSPEEKELAVKRLQGLASTKAAKVTWAEAKKTLRDWRLYFHYVSYICIAAPFASIALFSPSIVGGLGYEGLRAQLFTIPPYATAYLVTLCVALSAERYNARSLHASACMLAGSLGFLIQAILPPASFKARYAMLCLAAAGTFSSIPQLLAWLTINLHSTAAIGLAVALNITFSGPGQVVGTWIYRQSDAPRYRSGHLINFAVLLFGAVVVQGLRLYYVWKNKRLAAGQIPFLL